jgi:hypothetical protein
VLAIGFLISTLPDSLPSAALMKYTKPSQPPNVVMPSITAALPLT